LRKMVPHLLQTEELAMVCAPQVSAYVSLSAIFKLMTITKSFYNIPDGDPLKQNLDHYYAVTEMIHRGLEAGDCTGSGYIVRRQALMDIGGFPTFTISEDTACSTMLLGKGLKITYTDERIQCGQMPDTFLGHVKQRTRWTIGNVQTALRLNFRIGSTILRGCTIRQRLVGITTGLSSALSSTIGILGFFGLPLALLSGFPFVIYDNAWQLRWLLRTVSIWIFLDWSHRCAFALFMGYRNTMRWDQAESWLIPCESNLD
jgi:hypothetical protein